MRVLVDDDAGLVGEPVARANLDEQDAADRFGVRSESGRNRDQSEAGRGNGQRIHVVEADDSGEQLLEAWTGRIMASLLEKRARDRTVIPDDLVARAEIHERLGQTVPRFRTQLGSYGGERILHGCGRAKDAEHGRRVRRDAVSRGGFRVSPLVLGARLDERLEVRVVFVGRCSEQPEVLRAMGGNRLSDAGSREGVDPVEQAAGKRGSRLDRIGARQQQSVLVPGARGGRRGAGDQHERRGESEVAGVSA